MNKRTIRKRFIRISAHLTQWPSNDNWLRWALWGQSWRIGPDGYKELYLKQGNKWY